jgi:hypothetical protein
MTLYGYELFNRYWKKFDLYTIKNKKKVKNNPYSYFYKMIVRSYFNILKNYTRNNYENYFLFPNEDLEIFNNKQHNINYEEKNEFFKEKQYKYNDVIYDINIVSYSLLSNISVVDNNYIIDSLNNYLFTKEIMKFIKNDKSFNEILKLY